MNFKNLPLGDVDVFSLRNFIQLSSLLLLSSCSDKEEWRGIVVEPENRCSTYNRADYYYPQNIEIEVIAAMGGIIYGPYTGTVYDKREHTDIEHIVALSEGHDSGMCKASQRKKREFATDLQNLTLASPSINRCTREGKCGLDAGEWLPKKNKCWFAHRVVSVKRKYKLSVDIDEAKELESILSSCKDMDMIFYSESYK